MHLDWWTIVLQTVNFAILVWLLHRFLYKPVLGAIDARKAAVAKEFEAAKARNAEAQARFAAVEAQRAAMAAEREAALKAAVAQAQELAEARRRQAENDAAALIDETRKALVAERERALGEAQKVALDLGSDLARRLLAEVPPQFRAEAWIERIEQYLAALPPAERDALARQLGNGKGLLVVTAAALPAATAAEWKDRLARTLGTGQAIAFEADPKLIAGAELHFPTAILRFSWQSVLAAAQSEIGSHADAD